MNTRRYSLSIVKWLICVGVGMTATLASAAEPPTEQELLAILRSDGPDADKAIACKKLAIYGSSEAVADLAQLLPDERLSSWARIALEAIPDSLADDALRTATESLNGRLLIGAINSIGVRGDVMSVEALSEKLSDSDEDVAAAAAVALGHIGNEAATKYVRSMLAASESMKVRSAAAEGCVLCAEKLLAEGKAAAATEIYDEICNAEVPTQRIVEATRGAILSRGQKGIPLLIETLRSPNRKLFQLALGTAREFPGGDVDKSIAAELAKATPERAALIIGAMADRPGTVDLSTVLASTGKGEPRVRLAAINALQRIGDASCLPALLDLASDPNVRLAAEAKETLAAVGGDDVDAQIVQRLQAADAKDYELLLELVGQRRIAAVPEVLKGLETSNASIRKAALSALGETVSLERLDLLVDQVIAPKYPEDAAAAELALKTASVRMPDREACAAKLTAALRRAGAPTKTTLLEILSDVGGKTALATLATAAKSSDPAAQDTGSRLLGRWNGVDAAPVLLDLAKTAPASKYQVRALRGYIGLARKFAMPNSERAAMCQNALDASQRIEERKLVLDVLQLHPSVEGLELVVTKMRSGELKSDATAAALALAKKIGRTKPGVAKIMADANL